MLSILIILSLSNKTHQFYVTYMPPDQQLLTSDIIIEENDNFVVNSYRNRAINQDFAFTYGVWSRYNPLSQITQIGKFGIFDSSCFHQQSVMKKKEKKLNFLYYDCLDHGLITKNIKFRDNNGLDHSYTIEINPTQYESHWYFFSIIAWPFLEQMKMFIIHQENVLYFKEIKIKYPYFEKNLTLQIGGGTDGFYYSEQIQFSFFPGQMYAEEPTFMQLSPTTDARWLFTGDYPCELPSNLTILDSNIYMNTDINIFSTSYQNKNYFLLVGWIKILEIIHVDKDFTYKLLKLTTQNRNIKLTDDNLSPFCLYYHISEKGNQIIFTTYSYSFPQVNVDFTFNPYLTKEIIDLNIDFNVWQYFTVELSSNTLSVQFTFYDKIHTTFQRQLKVTQFQDIVFQIEIGNVLQRKDNYINFIASQVQFSNCDSVAVFLQDCHPSCFECDGPTKLDCLSCSIDSNRFYIPESKQCNCPYNTIDQITCKNHLDLSLELRSNQLSEITCPYGQCKSKDQECFQCPSIINDSQISCLECLTHPNEWINMLYCSQSLVSINGATLKLITENNYFYTFDGSGLNYCSLCQEICLDEECTQNNNDIQFELKIFDCKIKNCQICGLSVDQQFICILCDPYRKYSNGKCSFPVQFPSLCQENCASCINIKTCKFCFLPYYLNSIRTECILCNIPNCLYCFMFQINDRTINTLQNSYLPFVFDENTRIGCSQCIDGFNYDFSLEKCVQSIPKTKNCIRSFIELSGEEVCILSDIDDFNVAPQIINCQKYIANCEQCLLTPSSVIQCILCEKGFSASQDTGQCHFCDLENSSYCVDGSIKRDFWVHMIQSFLLRFLPDFNMYGFITKQSKLVTLALSCETGYRLIRLNFCVKDCDVDCLQCVEDANQFFCKKCPINNYGLTSLSATQGSCLICPQLCLICVQRTDFATINPMFIVTKQNIKYTYQCLRAIPDDNVMIDSLRQIALYCFDKDCQSVFEYQIDKLDKNGFDVFGEGLIYYENNINVDYCNRMGIKNFQLTIILETNQFHEITLIPIFLKKTIFSLQMTILYFLGQVESDTIISGSFTFFQFDRVIWQYITYTAEQGNSLIPLNNDFSIDLTMIDSIFTGESENQTFIQNKNFKDLIIQNVTLQNLHLKNMIWIQYSTNIEQTVIVIEQLTIFNCIFENVLIFSILNTTGSITIQKIHIIESQFVNTTFFYFNQTNLLQVITNIDDFIIDNCLIQFSKFIIQISANSLQIQNLQLINLKFNDTTFIVTDNGAIMNQIQITFTEFILSSFFTVIIQTSNFMNYQFSNFQIFKVLFTDSRIIYIHSLNNEINILLTNFQHQALISSQEEIIYLYDIKCDSLVINGINILNSSNVSYFNVYQTKSIQLTDIILSNQNQEQRIQASEECIQKIKILSILLRIQGFQQIFLKNFSIFNQYSIDYSLISIFQDLLFYKNGEGTVNIQAFKFFGNVLIKQSLGNIFSLLVIYSDFSQKISLKDLIFQENFFNQELDDPSKSAASLVYVNTQLSIIKLESINCLSNGLTNSSYPFMMINSLTQIYQNFTVANINSLNDIIWNKYYQIQLDFSTQYSNIIEFIQQIFTIQNTGVCQIIASQVSVENSTFTNIKAYSRSIFEITTQGQGIIILTDMQIKNTSGALQKSNIVDGCITIQSQNSNLNLKVKQTLFEQVYNRLDSAIFTIYPSRKQNIISLVNVQVIDCFSLINQFLFIQFSKESESSLYIKKLIIKNSIAGLIKYLSQISFPSTLEVSNLKSNNALLSVQNGNFQFNNIFITGILISQIFFLSDHQNGKIIDLSVLDVKVMYPLSLIQFSYGKDNNSTLVIQNVQINNAIQIVQTNIESQTINITDTLFIIHGTKNCFFSIEKYEKQIYSINDLIISLNYYNTSSGSLIAFFGQCRYTKINHIFIYKNNCNFCYNGLFFIQQNQVTKTVIQEFKCYGNKAKQYGCLALKISNKFDNQQNSLIIKNSAFHYNQGSSGVGVFSQYLPINIQQSLFSQNKASEKGGALFMQDIPMEFVIKKCFIFENYALIGGGLYLSGSSYLFQTNFDQSIIQFNTADLYSNNLVEAPDHLAVKINNIEMKSLVSNNQKIEILSIQPYKIFKGRSQYTTSLYLPSGQYIKNYLLFDRSNRIFVKYISDFSLIWKNSMNEDLIGYDQDECLIFDSINLEESLDEINLANHHLGNVLFNSQLNYFDLMELKVTHNPYINQISYISFQCTSVTQTKSLFYQINAETFNCQQGEFFSNNECKICEPIYGFYSVTINSIQCSIFDGNKFSEITQNQIKLKRGFWRPKFTSNIVEPCFKKQEYCIGGWGVGNNLCLPGYIGGLCEECDIYNLEGNGYYAQSETNICNICSDQQYQYVSPIFLMLWYFQFINRSFISLLLSLKSNRQTSKTFARLRATTALYEILFKLSQDFENILLKMFLNYLWLFSVIFTFNITFDFSFKTVDSISTPSASVATNLDCLLSQIQNIDLIYLRIVFMITFILIQISIVSGGIKIFSVITKAKFDLSQITNIFLYLFVTNQAALVKSLSSLLAIRTISEQQFIQGNVSMLFDKIDHLNWVFSFILPSLLIIGVFIPLILFFILFCNQNQSNSVNFKKHFGYLFNDYNKQNQFWEQVRILVRTTIIVFLTSFETSIYLKACLISLTILIYQILAQNRKPYIVNNLNFLDIESAQIVLLSIFLALIKYVCEQNQNLIPSMILQIIIGILLIGLCLSFIVRIVQLYSKKHYIFVLNLMNQLCKNYCKIGIVTQFFQKKLNQKLIKKYQVQINYQKLAAIINMNKTKTQFCFQKTLSKFQERKQINLLTPNLLKR